MKITRAAGTAVLAALFATFAWGQSSTTFVMPAAGEAVAEIVAAAPGAAWDKTGAEGSVATLSVDGAYNQDIIVSRGSEPAGYRVFLGPLAAGSHRIALERNPRWSAEKAGLEIRSVNARGLAPSDPEGVAIAHAPILYARADTLGRFTDAPLLMWYERFPSPQGDTLQYSVIFTNEDGGTPSDALLARWGHGTDIEYVYRVTLDPAGNVRDEIFQAPDHKDLHFQGKKVGAHPLMLVATLNNVFLDGGYSPVQYRMLPVRADLANATRESLMDANPWTFRVMSQELGREGKLREWGPDKGSNIGDPRTYLYIDLKVELRGAGGIGVWVKPKNDTRWYSSHRGRLDFAVARNGWIRTTVELPPGTKELEEVAVECLDVRDPRLPVMGPASECQATPARAFFLSQDYIPGANLLGPGNVTPKFRPGEKITIPLAR